MNEFSVRFDAAMTPAPPEVFLARRDLSLIGALPVTDCTVHNSTDVSEISFTVHKNVNGVEMPLWDQVDDFAIVYLRDGDAYFEIAVEIDETEEIVKKITGQALCESELGQIMLYDLEINSESDISRDDYTKPSVFYNPDDPENSLLHRVLEKAPHYTIEHVDAHLQRLVRSFSENDVSIYDFLTGTVAKGIDCVFVFNSASRSISVYDLEDYCVDCDERIGIADVCPTCGGTNIQNGYGEDTTILVAAQNLADSLTRTGDTGSVKNCFKLEGGDDLMTAIIANINPNGTSYIYHFSAAQKASMPQELREKLNAYDELYQSKLTEYKTLNQRWYDLIDELLQKQTSMMPASTDSGTTAEKELAKLTTANLSPVAVSNPAKASKTSVDNAVLAYAKVYVRGTYKVAIAHSAYSGSTWRGTFTVTLYGDDTDTATGSTDVVITVNGDENTFIKQRIDKALKQYDTKDENYDWTKYSLDMLSGYENAYQGVIDALIELGVSEPTHEFYTAIYLPYYNKLGAIRAEMVVREKEIADVNSRLDAVEVQKKTIQQALDIKAYLGNELWLTLYSYRREQTYSNDNFISDGLTNAELIERAEEFFKTAQKDLVTASRVQYSLSCNMNNLLVRPEFKPLWSKFRLYNWLRMQIDDEIHRMRFTSYQINYDQIKSLTVEFSDAIQTADGLSDLQSLLDKTQSMATSYEYVARQATKGKEANAFLENWFQNGLDATTVKLVNNAQNQSVIIDGHGVLSRRYDDEADAYANDQTKLLNAGLYITSDNWRSTDTAVGRFYYRDTKSGELKEAYGVNARVLVGQLILGEQMQITNAKGSLSFDENGLRVANGLNAFVVDPSTHNMVQIQKMGTDGNYTPQLYIDTNGFIHLADGTVIGAGSVIQGAAIGDGTTISGDVSLDLGAVTIPSKDASGNVVNKTFLEYLDADVANIISLQADSAIINALKTHYLDAGVVNADIANIKSIMAGNIGVGDLTAINLTAENVNIADAVIQDLIAKKITTLNLTAGSINTKDFTIQSDDGNAGLKIVGNTIQIYDKSGTPGVQLGYDTNGTPSLILRDANGAIMLDSQGLHDEIVPDQFVKTDMVADKAITGGKIDWSDISESTDKDGNPVWSAASVKIDGKGLDIKFSETTEKINSLSGQTDAVRIVGKNCFTKDVGGVLTPENIVLTAEQKNLATISKWSIDDVEITRTTPSTTVPWVSTGKATLTIPRDYMATRQSISIELCGTSSKTGASNDLKDVLVVYRVQDGQNGTDGVDGRSVTKIIDHYLLSAQKTNVTITDNTWATEPLEPTKDKPYLWNYKETIYSSGDPQTSIPCIISSFNKTITGSVIEYAVSTSASVPQTGWTTDVLIPAANEYCWTRTTITYSDGTTDVSYSVSRIGEKGSDGAGVIGTTVTYAKGVDSTTAPTTGWTDSVSQLTLSAGDYLWTRTVTHYSQNVADTTAYSVTRYGSDGNGIRKITNYYLATSKSTGVAISDGGWTTDPTEAVLSLEKKYLWNYEVIEYTTTTNKDVFPPKLIGNYSKDGDNGKDGTSVSSVVVQYYMSTSATELQGDTWSSTRPTWVDGRYLWTKTVTTLQDADGKLTSAETTPVCVTGSKGQTGAAGAAGRGLSSYTEQYAMTQNKTTVPAESEWGEIPLTWKSGWYIWTRVKLVYSNPIGTEYTAPVCDTAWEAANAVNAKVDVLQKKVTLNEALALSASCALEYVDYAFEQGVNGVTPYNTKENGVVTITREQAAVGALGLPTASGYYLKVQTASGETDPELGGIQQAIPVYPNAKYVLRYLLKLPPECTVHEHVIGELGTGGSYYWVTDTVGTGGWEEYVLVVECGEPVEDVVTYGSIGYLSVSSQATARPVTWYVGAIWAVNTAYMVDVRSTVSSAISSNNENITQAIKQATTYTTTDAEGNTVSKSITEKLTEQESTIGSVRSSVTSLTTIYDADNNPTQITNIGSYVEQTLTNFRISFKQSIDSDLQNYYSYINFGSGANGEPQLTLGKSYTSEADADSVRLCLYNDQVAMVNGINNKLTWWTTDAFYCTNGQFTEQLSTPTITVGKYRWQSSTHTYKDTTYDRLTLVHVA